MRQQYPLQRYTQSESERQIAHFVRLDNPKSYPFDHFHSHEYNEIIVFIKGGGKHNINFKEYEIRPMSIHLLAAHDLHWLERSLDSEGFAIVYKEQLLHKLQTFHPEIDFSSFFEYSKVINLEPADSDGFSFILQELRKNESPSGYQFQLMNAFIVKVAMIAHLPPRAEKVNDPLVHDFLQLVDKHFKTKKTVFEYATLLHLSERTLQGRIKSSSGHTPSELIHDRILREAKRLLCISEDNVKSIAFDLGFSDSAHFNNWFKKKTGITPCDYKHSR